MPKRIQRQRTKGWKMPASARYVGRPTRYGNPFKTEDYLDAGMNEVAAREMAVCAFQSVLEDGQASTYYRTAASGLLAIRPLIRLGLAGLDLACWCRLDQPCHADVLLKIANS